MEKKKKKEKLGFGYKVGIFIVLLGVLLIIVSFIIHQVSEVDNPYTMPKKNPKTVADTFVVPKDAKYDSKYHIYLLENDSLKMAYSYPMFQKHEYKNMNIKIEGAQIFQTKQKTTFSFVLYNLSEDSPMEGKFTLTFYYWNDGKIDSVVYSMESLQPLESKSLEIQVSNKVLYAYDYKITTQ